MKYTRDESNSMLFLSNGLAYICSRNPTRAFVCLFFFKKKGGEWISLSDDGGNDPRMIQDGDEG